METTARTKQIVLVTMGIRKYMFFMVTFRALCGVGVSSPVTLIGMIGGVGLGSLVTLIGMIGNVLLNCSVGGLLHCYLANLLREG
jgi:hypothetical protein